MGVFRHLVGFCIVFVGCFRCRAVCGVICRLSETELPVTSVNCHMLPDENIRNLNHIMKRFCAAIFWSCWEETSVSAVDLLTVVRIFVCW